MGSTALRRVLCGLALFGAATGCSANNKSSGPMTNFPMGIAGTGTGTPAASTGGTTGTMTPAGGNVMSGSTGGKGGSGVAPAGTGGVGMMTTGTGGSTMAAMGTGGTGTGGMTGAAGASTGGTGGMASTTPTATMPCITKGSDLLMIGDSYIDTPVNLAPVLEGDATKDMQLPAGQHYTMKAVAGTVISQIKNQWEANKSPAPKFVVMDGGGNDVLLGAPQCLTASAGDVTCMGIVDTANMTGNQIMQDIKASGVAGMIYFFYPHIPLGGAAMLDYSLPIAQKNCEAANSDTFKCIFVNTQPALDNHPEYYLDGIHPSVGNGPQALADVVWKAMKDNCIGQESGCCKP
jgi:lysophospholipase L1-like esterase